MCFKQHHFSFLKPLLNPSLSFNTFLCLLFLSLCLKCLSVISPSIYHVSSFPLSVCHSFFFSSLLSSLSLLVISTCQAKGSRQMDGQMNTQICRGAKRMMERWNKGVTVRDCAQLSPVHGLGESRGDKEEEKYRQKGKKWWKRFWKRMDFNAVSVVLYITVTSDNPWHNCF